MPCFIKEPTVKDYQPKRIRVEWVETWRDAEGDLVEEGLQREFTNGINGWKRAASFAFELGSGLSSSRDVREDWGVSYDYDIDRSSSQFRGVERVTVIVDFMD